MYFCVTKDTISGSSRVMPLMERELLSANKETYAMMSVMHVGKSLMKSRKRMGRRKQFYTSLTAQLLRFSTILKATRAQFSLIKL